MGLFGFGGGDNGAGEFKRKMFAAGDRLRTRQNRFDTMGDVAASDAGQYRSRLNDTLGVLEGLVNRDTTDSERTSFVNKQTANVTGAYNTAKQNLNADLVARGITDSSLTAGSLAGLEGARAGAMATAQNDATEYFDERQYGRTQDLLQLLEGLFSGASNREASALGASAGIDQGQLSLFGNLYSDAEARNAAEQNQALSLLGGIGASAGWFGGRGKGRN